MTIKEIVSLLEFELERVQKHPLGDDVKLSETDTEKIIKELRNYIWHKYSEEEPKNGNRVLCLENGNNYFIAYSRNGDLERENGAVIIKHNDLVWMELPKDESEVENEQRN